MPSFKSILALQRHSSTSMSTAALSTSTTPDGGPVPVKRRLLSETEIQVHNIVKSVPYFGLSEAVLELREPQTLLTYGSKQSGSKREFHRLNRSSLCSVFRARARLPATLSP
jgi:hypothetical protein